MSKYVLTYFFTKEEALALKNLLSIASVLAEEHFQKKSNDKVYSEFSENYYQSIRLVSEIDFKLNNTKVFRK